MGMWMTLQLLEVIAGCIQHFFKAHMWPNVAHWPHVLDLCSVEVTVNYH